MPVISEDPEREPVDFANIPAYKEFINKISEAETLMDLDYDLTQVKKKKDEIKRRSPDHKIKEEELKELIECQV